MTDSAAGRLNSVAAFEDPPGARSDSELVVDVDGFEGPLDLLLKLARNQRVDLTRISILALADQYLAFVEAARRLKLEIAADYLVMAAWLAYLKSRLLLPGEEDDDEPCGDELAAVLAERLRRLEAMREAGAQLMSLPRLGQEVFARGMPEPIAVAIATEWDTGLYDLLSSYAALRLRQIAGQVRIVDRAVMTLQEARTRLLSMLGNDQGWAALDSFLAEYLQTPAMARTARAGALSASLELVHEGEIELNQSEHFAPLFIRRAQIRRRAGRAASG